MSQLVVRNLPVGVKEGLRRQASRHGRSLEAEARTILADAVSGRDPVLDWLDDSDAFREESGGIELPAAPLGASREVEPL